MKTLKTSLASLLALAAIGTASAEQKSYSPTTPEQTPTKIYITGSTAFRGATVTAINAVVGVTASAWDGATAGVTGPE